MQKSFLKIILLQCAVTFSLLQYIQGEPECAKCPKGYSWSECVSCEAYCSKKCTEKCTPGCQCTDKSKVLVGYACVDKKYCERVAVDPRKCPVGARVVYECMKCEDFCPGHIPSDQCDCQQCVWDCKCFEKDHVIDKNMEKCVPIKDCSGPVKP